MSFPFHSFLIAKVLNLLKEMGTIALTVEVYLGVNAIYLSHQTPVGFHLVVLMLALSIPTAFLGLVQSVTHCFTAHPDYTVLLLDLHSASSTKSQSLLTKERESCAKHCRFICNFLHVIWYP